MYYATPLILAFSRRWRRNLGLNARGSRFPTKTTSRSCSSSRNRERVSGHVPPGVRNGPTEMCAAVSENEEAQLCTTLTGKRSWGRRVVLNRGSNPYPLPPSPNHLVTSDNLHALGRRRPANTPRWLGLLTPISFMRLIGFTTMLPKPRCHSRPSRCPVGRQGISSLRWVPWRTSWLRPTLPLHFPLLPKSRPSLFHGRPNGQLISSTA